MDDPLDNELKKRIREVFENFEDTSADEGWLLLRERFPEKANRHIVAWLWVGSAVALLLLFLGVLWLNYRQQIMPQLANTKNPQKTNLISKSAVRIQTPVAADSSAAGRENQLLANAAVRPSAITPNLSYRSNKSPGQRVNAHIQLTYNQLHTSPIRPNRQVSSPAIDQTPAITSGTAKTLITTNPPKAQKQDSPIPATAMVLQTDTGHYTTSKSITATTAPGINMLQHGNKPVKSIFESDNTDLKDIEKPIRNDKKVRFGVYAATYFNYAKGSSNQFNLGAGFTSDIRLTDNLKLSTGMSIAQNTLNYNNQIPSGSLAPAIVTTVGVPKTTAAALQTYSFSVATPSVKNYNASLIGLDIPLNLKYVFNPNKSDTYISAGLSSGTFINETYNYSYNYPSLLSANVSQVQGESTHQSFNGFYFARTLNFSFGTGYPLGKNNRLIIEPFLKYPLDGLGTQQIRFGAGGLNLKFNFKSAK